MPSNSQQATDASVQAQTSAALSAVPVSVWRDLQAKTGCTKAQFSNGFTLPTKEHLHTILANQNRDRSNGVEPNLYMYEPAGNCKSWRRSPLKWDFPVLEATEQKYEMGTGYPASGTKLHVSHVGHFLNETPLPKSEPDPNDQLVFGHGGDFAQDTNKTSGDPQRFYAREYIPKRPQIVEARGPAILARSGRAPSTSSHESCRSGAS